MAHGQPRHGDWQYRPPRRGREPVARPEQCPGCVRHGLVPARAVGLPPCRRRRDPRSVRGGLGPAGRRGARPAHPQHARLGDRRHVHGPVHPGRGHRPVRPQHAACHGRPGRDGMRGDPGPVPERDRELRPCLLPRRVVPGEGRHLHQRRAADQPGADGDAAHGRQARVAGGGRALDRHGLSHAL